MLSDGWRDVGKLTIPARSRRGKAGRLTVRTGESITVVLLTLRVRPTRRNLTRSVRSTIGSPPLIDSPVLKSSAAFPEGAPVIIMRRLHSVVLAVAVSFAPMGCEAAVQPPEGNQQGRPLAQEKTGPKVVQLIAADENYLRSRLLLLETVQKDLGLSAKQVEQINDLAKTGIEQGRKFWAKSREVLPSGSMLTEEFEARMREYRALVEDYQRKGKELRTKTLGMLTPGQNERLSQIRLQQSIPAALARPEIIKALGISEEQSKKISTLRDQVTKKAAAQMPDLSDLIPAERRRKTIEYLKASDKTQAEATKPVLDILTPDQRARFDKLQGKKIDLTMPYEAWMPEDADSWPD
jgi:hypothetical protein